MARPDAGRARERRIVAGGVVVLAAALLFTYAVVPFTRRWVARESQLDAAQGRVRYLQDLVSRTGALEASAADVERTLSLQPRRVLHARSSTLAASALQTFLQDAADASHLAVMRLEVSPDDSVRAANSDSSEETVSRTGLPATLSAYGDIGGVASFLAILATGPRVLTVERLSLLRNSALLGAPDVVQITLTLRAPVLPP